MTDTKTGHIERVNPADLTVGDNVRTDAQVDAAFVNSIKEHGILQPPMVTLDHESGTYEIVFGHRRTLGAIEAGLTEIDVYVVAKAEAEAARLIDQLTENDQRQQLTEAERVGGYKKLQLFGISPAQIARRTTVHRKTVDTALAVADNEAATTALAEYSLTLDQAAALVEFNDDKNAIKKLTEKAETDPARFDHLVADLRKARALAESKREVNEQLTKDVATVYKFATWHGDSTGDAAAVSIAELAHATSPTEPLTPGDVIGKPFAAGRVLTTHDMVDGQYKQIAKPQYFVVNPDDHGFVKREYVRNGATPLTPEEEAERQAVAAQREAVQRERAEQQEKLATAAEVRRAFLSELVQRTKLPTGWNIYAARMITEAIWSIEETITDVFYTIASIPPHQGDDYEGELSAPQAHLGRQLAANPKLADRVLLTYGLTAAETLIDRRHGLGAFESTIAIAHLEQLITWGYTLSEAETQLLGDARETVAATADEQDEAATEDDQ